jgi:aromatic-L-amino-acid/L-tryptophan decarboxylase
VDKIGRVIRQNVAQAAYLGRRVAEAPDLELLAPVALNVVCFRYVAPGLHAAALDALNTELLTRLQESGVAAPSGTRVRGAYAIRCAITNHRSQMADFDLLLDETRRLGAALLAEARAPEAVALP